MWIPIPSVSRSLGVGRCEAADQLKKQTGLVITARFFYACKTKQALGFMMERSLRQISAATS